MKIQLMIVDDSLLIRKKIMRSHNSELFNLTAIATNGAEAVELFLEHRPQAVTMDLTMPELDGIECIKQLMIIDPKVQILVVSALSDEATGIKALKLGASGFLLKPFSEAQLADALAIISEDIQGGIKND